MCIVIDLERPDGRLVWFTPQSPHSWSNGHLELVVVTTEPDDIGLLQDPVLARGLAVAGQESSIDGGAANDVGVLSETVAREVREDIDEGVDEGRTALLGGLALAQDGAGPNDDGLLKVERLDGVLDALLHLGVGHAVGEHALGTGRGYENEGLDALLAGGLGNVDVHWRKGKRHWSALKCSCVVLRASSGVLGQLTVMVDLPLVGDAAGCGSGGADRREEHVGRRSDGGQGGSPL